MLLFTREQFHLNFIQVYLQGGKSIFQDGPHQLIVFSWIRPIHVRVWYEKKNSRKK